MGLSDLILEQKSSRRCSWDQDCSLALARTIQETGSLSDFFKEYQEFLQHSQEHSQLSGMQLVAASE